MNLTIKKILTPYNFSDRNDTRRIKYIVIHFFGSLGTALAVANYFANAYRGASAHYNLDDGPIVYQSVEDEDVAWHCGTTGTYFHPECRNSNSIGIEVRPYKVNAARADYAEDKDWYFTEQTIRNLIELVRYLMEKYNVDINHVVRHYDVTHKWCPRPYMGDDINTVYNVTGNSKWSEFKTLLLSDGSEEEDMDVTKLDISQLTDEQVDALITRFNQRLAKQPTSEYAIESCKKGIQSGLFADGDKDVLVDNPQGYLKRQEFATVLNRAGLLDKKK